MAASKITYGDKVGVTPKETHINQVWDDDMNEIKVKVNTNADLHDALEIEVDTNTLDIIDLRNDIDSFHSTRSTMQTISTTPASTVIALANTPQNVNLIAPSVTLSNFTFNGTNTFTYTGPSGVDLLFLGGANETITTTIAPGTIVDVTMILQQNGVDKVLTPVGYTNKDETSAFSANYIFLNVQQNDTFKLQIKSTVAHTVFIKALYIQLIQLR